MERHDWHVSEVPLSYGCHIAHCSCGHFFRKRTTKLEAEQDAILHRFDVIEKACHELPQTIREPIKDERDPDCWNKYDDMNIRELLWG